MDRFVIDQTGVTGEFTFAFECKTNEDTPSHPSGFSLTTDPAERQAIAARAAATPRGRELTIFQALEPLGLRLDRITGPAEYLQIESVQRPAADARRDGRDLEVRSKAGR